jgi:ParB family chromosome partitioning protein
MEIKEIAIDKIKPDKEQPRKTFDNEKIKLLAESILSNGLLIPIDIDENHYIIEGERRYRAHKLAKLKKISCRIIKLKKDKILRLKRQLISDLQDEKLETEESYEAIVKLYNLEGKPNQGSFCNSLGIHETTLRRALNWTKDKEENPKSVEGISAGVWREIRNLPEEDREEIKRELKETKEPFKKLVEEKKEKIQTKKELEELRKKSKEIQEAKKLEFKITTTKEVLDDIKNGIFRTHNELNGLMSRIRRIRRTRFYLRTPREKESFIRFLESASIRATKWARELDNLRETIEIEIIRE